MEKVTGQNRAAQLQLSEVVKDYGRKLLPGSIVRCAHEQDDDSATLVLHIQGGSVDDLASVAKLAERLKAASESVADELAAAEVDKAKAAKSAKAEPKKVDPPNEQVQKPTPA